MITYGQISKLISTEEKLARLLHYHPEMNPQGLRTRVAELTPEELGQVLGALNDLRRATWAVRDEPIVQPN
jgi:hypothetical protein